MKRVFLLFFVAVYTYSTQAQTVHPLVDLEEFSSTIILEIRYATSYNFVGEKVDGYEASKCLLTKSAAEALAQVQSELLKKSYSLKVFDCYRPQQAVDHFVRWANSDFTDSTKQFYFPRVPSNELFSRGYIAEKSGHSRGSTVDLTIVKLPYKTPVNFNYNCLDPKGNVNRGSELNMGTAFDCFDEMSHTYNEQISEEIQRNRKILADAMEKEGFINYSKEWWHFTYKPEEYPDTYFDLVIE